jgi:hypothetical protein
LPNPGPRVSVVGAKISAKKGAKKRGGKKSANKTEDINSTQFVGSAI